MDDRSSTDSGVKRRLQLEEKDTEELADILPHESTPMVTDAMTKPSADLEEVDDDERNKRSKRDGAISTSTGSAGSREDPVRSQ
jgi:hypothetical protein